MMMNYCLKSCSTWQRTLAFGLVYTVGPSMELLDTWTARETLGASSAEYSILWFDAFVFSLIMQMSLPFIASTLGIPFRHFICQVVFYIPFGATWATVLPPQWVIGTDADYLGSNASRGRLFFLMLLALIASIGIFAGLDQTSREFVERSRAHERYIAALSHDFGTPISALQMATSQLPQHMRSPVEDSGVKPLLDGMAAALEVMAALKRKAIDVGKLQLGESLTPERAPFNLRELIMRKLPAITRYMPHNASVHVEYVCSDDIEEGVVTDGSWVFMILLNFVSNAFKATQVGSVTVTARLAAGHLRLTVSDTGVGVSSAIERSLWTAFKQASRWQSGTGLGLYHVRSLAVGLGGTVGYQPNIQAGNGSTFWVDLPYVPCSLSEADANSFRKRSHTASEAAKALSPKVRSTGGAPSARPSACGGGAGSPEGGHSPGGAVLIAEDNVFILELTEALVRSVGIERVELALNGEDALAKLTASDAPEFALVLMDVLMPFMDGIECTRRVRAWEAQQPGRPHLRILALSANGEDAACQRDCLDAGMDGVLCKPINRQTLCQLLEVAEPPSEDASPSLGSFNHKCAQTMVKPSPPSTGATTEVPNSVKPSPILPLPPSVDASRAAPPKATASGWEVSRRGDSTTSSVLGTVASHGDSAFGNLNAFDAEAVYSQQGGDAALAQQVVASFDEHREERLAPVLAAAHRGDAHNTHLEAHALKGICGYVGAPALRAAALQVELAAKAATTHGTPLEVEADIAALLTEAERLSHAHRRFLHPSGSAGHLAQDDATTPNDAGGVGAAAGFSPHAAHRC